MDNSEDLQFHILSYPNHVFELVRTYGVYDAWPIETTDAFKFTNDLVNGSWEIEEKITWKTLPTSDIDNSVESRTLIACTSCGVDFYVSS